jgi:hypothetical protein
MQAPPHFITRKKSFRSKRGWEVDSDKDLLLAEQVLVPQEIFPASAWVMAFPDPEFGN